MPYRENVRVPRLVPTSYLSHEGGKFGGGGDFRHLEFEPGTRYGGNGKLPQAWRELFLVFTKVTRMSSRTGNWMIAVGAVALVLGLVALPAALGEHVDTSLLTLGACGVSLGSMIAAGGFYLKARVMKAPDGSSRAPENPSNHARRVRGGCDVCHGDLPVIHCKVHQVHLCPDCVAKHYDFRSCTYTPSTRGAAPKTAKALTKTQGA